VKVHIVHLDAHDDYMSTRDKLGWAKSPRVLIVWPKYGRVLNRRLDLVLLQRYASQHNLQIGLVTHDAEVLDNAEVLAMPTFDNIDNVTDAGWRRRARGRPKPMPAFPKRKEISIPTSAIRIETHPTTMASMHKTLQVLLLIFTLTVLGCFTILLLSRAEMVITPATKTQSVDFILSLDPSLDIPGLDGSIPSQFLTLRVSDDLRLPTSGEVAVPDSPAKGFVTFTNLTSDSIDIEAGTGLRATNFDNQRFVTLESVSLSGEIGAEVEAAIEAAMPGPAGNLPTGAIDAVEGTLGLQVEATNIVYLSGGENEIRAAVAEVDFDKLEEALLESLEDQALQMLSAQLIDDQILLVNSLKSTHQYERIFDREIGEPADTLGLTMDVEFSVYAYRQSDAQTAANFALDDQLPTGFQPVPSSFGFEVRHDNVLVQNDDFEIDAQAWQEIFLPPDKDLLREILQWEKPAQAVSLVSQRINSTEPPKLNLHPAWLPRIPFLLTQISIRYSWQVDS
jgi:hypothetical protein